MTAPPEGRAPASRAGLLLAYAIVYVVWGSTYLAIRIAVESWPPLLLAAARFAIAGAGLYLFLRARGVPAPDPRSWPAAALVGGLMLGGGNGTVCWAEQWVPSGETSLILASGPLWTVVLLWLAGRGERPRPLVTGGVLVGLAGVAILIGAGRGLGGGTPGGEAGPWLLVGRVSLLFASLSWVTGSILAPRMPLPVSSGMAIAMEMLAASPILLVAAILHGDLASFHPAAIAPAGWAALAYLVGLGSLAGFGAYTYLLVHAGPMRASTGAFVNPVVAVLLGALFAREPIGPLTFVAAAMIVIAVAGVVLGTSRRRAPAGQAKSRP